ncbi:DUF2441 domain-containing protein [Natrialba sp. SSL1]|uniref:DUF2441 domain-containing protein n=1 Tax=Natrialba sp. SSL1 TaxID=1869245 RepID=UPI0008F8633F|nr:DUF2441 domain-containing protein [Natrialba sp. SSL1]OIB56156.1 hypothetical protein BBD46_19305 [Natrialba sp. SSL1]
MPTGYHVDRSNTLEPGDTLVLENEPQINPEKIVLPQPSEENAIQSYYPEGLSRHGARYVYMQLARNNNIKFEDNTTPMLGIYQIEDLETEEQEVANKKPTNAIYEWVFEFVRRSEFPDHPSRFQSFFGVETEQEATAFQSDFDPDAQIVEVEYSVGVKADMDLLSCQSFADGLHQATTYWNGEPGSDDPTWEILMQPPVEVIG